MKTTLNSKVEIRVSGESVALSGDGTIFLPKYNALLVADLHLGKDASFRAAGIPIPMGINATTLKFLTAAIKSTSAESVYLLGDLIHNRDSMTSELVKQFAGWRTEHPDMHLTLVRGNHDRHVKEFPPEWGLNCVFHHQLGPFQLIHEVSDATLSNNDHFQIGGHWHPVVSVGRGADHMRLPCFVVGKRQITLPAFGPFKGGMQQKRNGSVIFYPICEGKVWSVS